MDPSRPEPWGGLVLRPSSLAWPASGDLPLAPGCSLGSLGGKVGICRALAALTPSPFLSLLSSSISCFLHPRSWSVLLTCSLFMSRLAFLGPLLFASGHQPNRPAGPLPLSPNLALFLSPLLLLVSPSGPLTPVLFLSLFSSQTCFGGPCSPLHPHLTASLPAFYSSASHLFSSSPFAAQAPVPLRVCLSVCPPSQPRSTPLYSVT